MKQPLAWWIGCSGFHYKHWREIFYPRGLPQKKWFEFYTKHFNTLELNVTFYRFPRLNILEDWYNRSPENFRFSVKMNKAITHYKQFNNTDRMIADFYGTVGEGLKEKVGCILFQLPPQSKYTEQRLAKVVNSLNPAYKNVLEFRNISWWNADVFNTLHKHQISFCGTSHPEFPDDVITTTSVNYYRLHGVPELYKSKYSLPQLKRVINQIETCENIAESYIYFNNDIDGSAFANAHQVTRYVNKKLRELS